MKKTILSLLLLPAMSLVGCSSDDDNITPPAQTYRPLNVEINETRAAITKTSTLTSFKLYAVDPATEYTLNKDDVGNWVPSPLSSWPLSADDDDKVTFYAIDGGSYSQSGQHVTLTVNEDAFNQKDLLVAKTDTSYTKSGGTLCLKFNHVCTAVNFYVNATNTLLGNLGGSTLYITEIKFCNVKNSGRYDLGTGEWTVLDGTSSYTLTDGTIAVTNTAVELPCKYLFMIPQTLGEDAKLEFKYKIGENGAEKSNSISLSGKTWNANEQKRIDIKLGTSLIEVN